MFLLRYFEIVVWLSVANILKSVFGRQDLATRIVGAIWIKHDLLRLDLRADRNRRRQQLVDTIAEIDTKLLEPMTPSVRKAMLGLRKLYENFIADLDRQNAKDDASI